MAASLAIETGYPMRALPVATIQQRLLEQGATLVYFRDIRPASEDFKMVQRMALRGYLPGWEAALDAPASAWDRALWRSLSGRDIPQNLTTRKEILYYLYTL